MGLPDSHEGAKQKGVLMKIRTTDFHTALRTGDPKNPIKVYERGSVVDVDEKQAKELIARGKAEDASKPPKGESK